MILAEWLGPAVTTGILIGFLIGRSCEGNRWMDSADAYGKLRWRGKLYKVELAGLDE